MCASIAAPRRPTARPRPSQKQPAAQSAGLPTSLVEPRLLHSLPGRLRIHLDGWSGRERLELERRLRQIQGVRSAQLNALTGNVLIRFDAVGVSARVVLATVRAIVRELPAEWRGPLAEPLPDEPTSPPVLREKSKVQAKSDEPARSNARGRVATRAAAPRRGRARVAMRGLDRNPDLARCVVEHLERTPGVQARANPLTGRVLVEWDEHRTDLSELVAQIVDVEMPELPGEDRPSYPLDPAPLVQSATRTVGAGTGLALLAVRRASGAAGLPGGANTAASISGVIGVIQGFPFLRNGLRRVFGIHVADLLFSGANILSLTFAGSPLGLALSGVEAARLLTEVVARRAAWRVYRDKIEALPPAHPGLRLRLEAGERAPLRALVVEGSGTCIGRAGLPLGVVPGALLDAGARLHGGPFVVELQAGPAFTPQPRPAPPRETLDNRYARLVGMVSLAYAALTGLATRSPSRIFQALLLVNPRAAMIGTEAANVSAAAQALRGGVTIVGTRLGRPIRRFDLLLLDGPRLVSDTLEVGSVVPLCQQCEAQDMLALAAGIAAAAGSPWGGVLPAANRAAATDGHFDGQAASASVGGTRYSLTPALAGATLPSGASPPGATPDSFGLWLRAEPDTQPLAVLWLRPRIVPGVRELVATCRQHGVELSLLAPDQPATQALARRAQIRLLPTSAASDGSADAITIIRARQEKGDLIALASDSADAAHAFSACDFAIGLTAGRSRFLARADVLAPDLGAITAIIEAGARRDLAVRDAVAFSSLANGWGAVWGWRGEAGIGRASYGVYVAALAAIADGWLRLSGGERPQSALARITDPRPEKWGRRSLDSVLHALDTTPQGLTADLARTRLAMLPLPPSAARRSWYEPFLFQLRSPLNAVLFGGAALSLTLGSMTDAGLIGATILLNTVVGAWQERQANRAAEALERMGQAKARVLRDGQPVLLAADQIVPGDMLRLASGDRVAADARMFRAQGLEVDEASLTGESLPVTKAPDAADEGGRIVLEGSDVTVGTGEAIVVAVGRGTRLGAMAAALAADEHQSSPLDARLHQMFRQSLPWSGAAGAIVAGSALLRGRSLASQAALGVSVAVAAVPEGLPLLAKMGEAAVAHRLADRQALVRRLASVEALGRVDVACTDKTGTLTQGRLALSVVADMETQGNLAAPAAGHDASANGASANGASLNAATTAGASNELRPALRNVLRCAGLASPHPDAPDAASHPTDVAVVRGAQQAGLDDALRVPRHAESPFDPVRAFHAVLAADAGAEVGASVLCVKGATEVLLARCDRVRRAGRDQPLDTAGREALQARVISLAEQGLRVLMVAQKTIADDDTTSSEAQTLDPRGLVALGFLGISDPLRPDVPAAVRRCGAAGVRVIMLTGDHPATAWAIAREAGLLNQAAYLHDKPPGQGGGTDEQQLILTGAEIAELDNPALDERLERTVVVARATPLDKVRIVEGLQRRGHCVAMTGDGVNDAPALRLADVGVAMGRGGTEVARQAADVVLVNDDFSTLVETFVEGRSFWRNIRRALGLLIGGNLGELGLQVTSSVIGLAPALTTTQLLAVNMMTDVLPAVAVALQQPENRDLAGLAREGTAAFDKPLRSDVLRRGLATGAPSLLSYFLATGVGGLAQGHTVAFVSIIATQLIQTLDAGRAGGGLSAPVLGAVAGSISLLGLALAIPALRGIFGLVMPTPFSWLLVTGGALLALLLSRMMPSLSNGLGTSATLTSSVAMRSSSAKGIAARPQGSRLALPEPV